MRCSIVPGRDKYKVLIAESAKKDIKEKKQYIIDTFKYRELGERFSKKIKKAVITLEVLPQGYSATEFRYKGHIIYLKPIDTYLLLYIVDNSNHIVTILRVLQDGMNWRLVMRRWTELNK